MDKGIGREVEGGCSIRRFLTNSLLFSIVFLSLPKCWSRIFPALGKIHFSFETFRDHRQWRVY